jgi:amino acid adenylation domain-containing protein
MADDARAAPSLLSDLLDRCAELRPGDDAVGDGRDRLDWATYRDRAATLADVLGRAGVGAGDRVGIHLPKSVDSFVAVHAVLRAGAVVVPVDWFAPPGYAESLLADAGASALITVATGDRLAAVRGTVDVVVDPRETGDVVTRAAPPGPGRSPHDPAYIIYTSGSTGRPKGIVHTHASALAYATLAADTYGLDAQDRLANIAPLHFDQSTFELYAAPLVGAFVLVVPDAMLRFPASLSTLLADERITVWYSVPYAITQLVERGALDERDLSSLRWVLFGGESFPLPSLVASMGRLPHARFSNVYGPAEVNQCTFHHLDRPPDHDAPVPIGRPWEGAELLIVDEDGDPTVAGEVGELWVASSTMMREYWAREDLTSAAVVERDGRRWYRTGDLVRELSSGDLVFLGRVDHQVKVRGHRVELEAVEAVIAGHPRVAACAVVVDRRDAGDDVLVAVVDPAPDDETTQELLDRLQTTLPRYAVPHRIVGLSPMPRTGTGKVDRHAAAQTLRPLRPETAHPNVDTPP